MDCKLLAAINAFDIDEIKKLIGKKRVIAIAYEIIDYEGTLEEINAPVDRPIKSNEIIVDFNKALILGAKNGHLNLVRYFVKLMFTHKIDKINSYEFCEKYAFILIIAAENGHLAVVQYLMTIMEHIWYSCYRAATSSARNGHLEVVKYFISLGYMDDGIIIESVKHGHLDIVKYLVESGFRIKINYYIFTLSVEHGHLDLLKYLNSLGFDNEGQNYHILVLAIENGHLDFVKYLLSLGKCEPTDTSSSKFGRNFSSEGLIDIRPSSSIATQEAFALAVAVKNGKLDIVKYLIGLGCGVIYRNKKFQKELQNCYTRRYSHKTNERSSDKFCCLIFSVLWNYGCDGDYSLLVTAVKQGNLDIVRCLIENNVESVRDTGSKLAAGIESLRDTGRTLSSVGIESLRDPGSKLAEEIPLMRDNHLLDACVGYNRLDILMFLADAGYDIRKNMDGVNLLRQCIQNENFKFCDYLIGHSPDAEKLYNEAWNHLFYKILLEGISNGNLAIVKYCSKMCGDLMFCDSMWGYCSPLGEPIYGDGRRPSEGKSTSGDFSDDRVWTTSALNKSATCVNSQIYSYLITMYGKKVYAFAKHVLSGDNACIVDKQILPVTNKRITCSNFLKKNNPLKFCLKPKNLSIQMTYF
jgi:ankyrin repeat protein